MWKGKPYPAQEPNGGPDRGQDTRKAIEKQLDSLLLRLQPTPVADDRRQVVLEYVQEVIQREVPGSKIFPVGSFPLKTYLPYADVDMVMFPPRSGPSTSSVGASLGEGEAGSSGKEGESSDEPGEKTDDHPGGSEEISNTVRAPSLLAVNTALCSMAALAGSRRGPRPQNGDDGLEKPEIRNVSYINARTPIVTMLVGNVVVDLTDNQGGSVAASALLEEADNLIQRDHLFKRSLLVLKAWAWCETPRLVGTRVLGAQKGGLTSYGLSVMVLHLFASKASADDLVHPLDVFIRFFEVYSEFDWARNCLTLDGPLPFGSVRQPRLGGGSKGAGGKKSRLQPLVRRILAELSPGVEKEKEKEKDAGKPARRGRRGSKFGRTSDGRDEDSSTSGVDSPDLSGTSPHFPRRDCNIQDPLNALNNLGHSVTKENLRALRHALQRGRRQLEAWQLLPPVVRPGSRSSEGPQRRPPAAGVAQPEQSPGGRSAKGSVDTERSEAVAGIGAEDDRVTGGNRTPSPQPSPPLVEQLNSAHRVPHQFGPPAQYVLLPPPQVAHPGVNVNHVPPQPVWVPGPQGQGQPIVVAFPQPFLQTVPHQYQIPSQPPPYTVSQGQPGVHRPYSAALVPAPGTPAHPYFSPQQFQLQRFLPVAYQGEHQFASGHQRFARVNVLPAGWGDQATAHSGVSAADPKLEERHKSAPQAEKSEGSTVENGCKGQRRKLPEEARDPPVHGSMLPWDLGTFVQASATSSTASLSDVVDYGSKDGQDCHFQSESGADDETLRGSAKENLIVLSCDASDHSSYTTVDTRHGERGEGALGLSGKLWAHGFLREVFPECCRRYGSGDGFREDLLDHPCQRRSKLQEPGAPSPRRHGAPNVLQGDSRAIWNSVTTVGKIRRETGPQPNWRNAKKAEPPLENEREVVGAELDGETGRSEAKENQAGVEQRATKVGRMDAVAPAYSGGDHLALSTNTGGDAPGVGMLRPREKVGEVGTGDRPQWEDGDGPKSDDLKVSVSVDDETGYTSEDASSSSASSSPPAMSPSLTNLSVVSASTQTMDSASAGKAGIDVGMQFSPETVDQGVQCLAPVSTLMVSSASQCEDPARMSTSAGVQCGTPAPAPPVSRGTQCRSDATRGSPVGIQCGLLVEEVAPKKTPSAPPSPSSTLAGAGTEASEECDSSGACVRALPSDTAQSVPDAAGPIVSPTGAFLDERETASKSKKRRKKAKATAAALRAAAVEESVHESTEGSSKAIQVRLGGWIGWVMKGMLFWGVAGVVLATAVWGVRGRAGEASGQDGSGLLTLRGVHNVHDERAQPPVWVKVGGSFTLGDVRAPRRSATGEGGAGGVQWFKGGHALSGQTRPFLTVPTASREDEGTYACFAVEESGQLDRTPLWEEVTVRISKPPMVESQLQTQRLARGDMLVIVATASGVPQPEFQWRRNGVPIPGANRPMFVKHSVSEADMGTYTCDVYNVAGSMQWEEMAVVLREGESEE